MDDPKGVFLEALLAWQKIIPDDSRLDRAEALQSLGVYFMKWGQKARIEGDRVVAGSDKEPNYESARDCFVQQTSLLEKVRMEEGAKNITWHRATSCLIEHAQLCHNHAHGKVQEEQLRLAFYLYGQAFKICDHKNDNKKEYTHAASLKTSWTRMKQAEGALKLFNNQGAGRSKKRQKVQKFETTVKLQELLKQFQEENTILQEKIKEQAERIHSLEKQEQLGLEADFNRE